MTNQEKLNTLIQTNQELAETNKEAVGINKISFEILKSEREKNAALLKICGKTHSYLVHKNDKNWEEEEICRIIYSQLTGLPIQKSNH